MAGMIAYLLIVAVPTYLLALFRPWLALVWVAVLLIGSTHRVMTVTTDLEREHKAYWFMALPSYVFAALMVVLWFRY